MDRYQFMAGSLAGLRVAMTRWNEITNFYRWRRARGIYINAPDWYFLTGSNKDGMGYRETSWSLPRAGQVIIGQQKI